MKNRKNNIKIDWAGVIIIGIISLMYFGSIVTYLTNASSNTFFINTIVFALIIDLALGLYIIITEMPFVKVVN